MWHVRFVNCLLIAVLLVTTLPLKQVGSLLFKNQLTEELSEDYGSGIQKKPAPEGKDVYLFPQSTSVSQSASEICTAYHYLFASVLPLSPYYDRHHPPPDRQ